MSKGYDIKLSRKTEIADLAETVAGNSIPIEPEGILSNLPDVTVAYGRFGEAFDGLIERREQRFWVYCNVDRAGPQGSARARFTLAHEAGHYFIDEHRNALMGLSAPHLSRSDYTSNELVEREADLFAAHLLMPTERFKREMATAGIGAPAIFQLSKKFGSSITSTALRCVGLTDDFLAVIKWDSKGFGWRWVSRHAWEGRYIRTAKRVKDLPRDCATAIAIRGFSNEQWVERGSTAATWFDYVQLGGRRDQLLMEQAIVLGDHGVLTVLYPADS